jgi:hypothetical protein
VSGAMEKFDEEGNLIDGDIRKQLIKYMSGFTEFVAHLKG